jgi:uncharacterized repeat protein (TIGR01451 family)
MTFARIARRFSRQPIASKNTGGSKMLKLFRLMMAAGLIGVILGALHGALVWAASYPYPTYGTATVDGAYGEWNLAEDGTGDFFANMYRSADSTKDVLSKLYLRYDCSSKTLYALVLVETGHTIDVDADPAPGEEHFIKINGSKIVDDGDQPPSGGPPDFEWIGLSGDGTTADGWEASASLDPGTYNDFDVHTQVDDDETSAVEGRQIDLVINCLADLVVSKWGPAAVSTTCGSQGEFMWYITVFNQGSAVAENVTVADTLPAGVEYLSDTSGITPDISGNVITWDLWRLDPGTGVYFWMEVDGSGVSAGTVLTNRVDVSTASTESDYSNNHAEWSTLVSSDKGADVWVEKIGPDSVFPGSYMVYTINYGNGDWHCEGSMDVVDAEDVTITDIMSNWDKGGNMFPNYLSYVSDTSGFPHSGTGTIDDPIVWTVGTLLDNHCGSFEVTVYVHADAPDSLTLSNDAIISSGTEECDATNNDYEVDTPVEVSGSIGDYVWNDVDRDGIQDSNESGINGVVVELYKDGVLLDSTTTTNVPGTSKLGWYLFTALDAGDYIVKVADSNFASDAVLEDYFVAVQNAGSDDTIDSDGHPVTHEVAVTLASGENNMTIDFGFSDCELGDRVWHDQDGYGDQNGTEPGFNDVHVYLYKDNGDGNFDRLTETFWYSTTTMSGTSRQPDGYPDGIYGFDMSVPGAGDYWVWVDESTLPTGQWTLTTASNPLKVEDYASGDIFTFDFGYVALGSIGDYVWIDESGDGAQGYKWPGGPLEVGINDVELELWLDNPNGISPGEFDIGDTRTMTMTTQTHDGSDGWYLFTDLSPGTYFVRIAPAEFDSGGTLFNYGPTVPNAVITDTVDSDGDNPTCPYSPTIKTGECGQVEFENNILATTTLTAGSMNDLTIDFGVVYTGPPTAVTLSSFAARPSIDDPRRWLWLGLAGLTVLAAGGSLWIRRQSRQGKIV